MCVSKLSVFLFQWAIENNISFESVTSLSLLSSRRLHTHSLSVVYFVVLLNTSFFNCIQLTITAATQSSLHLPAHARKAGMRRHGAKRVEWLVVFLQLRVKRPHLSVGESRSHSFLFRPLITINIINHFIVSALIHFTMLPQP